MPEPIPGYRRAILDGNVLAGTDHRLIPTRTTWSACLPGKSLAIYEPASGLIIDVVLEEDAHTQERACLMRSHRAGRACGSPIATSASAPSCSVSAGRGILPGATARVDPAVRGRGPVKSGGRCPTGKIFEQAIGWTTPRPRACPSPAADRPGVDEPTRDGETEIVLVTNLPEEVSAIDCCVAYRGRWRIEGHFQVLTDLLHCEIPSLGYRERRCSPSGCRWWPATRWRC